jgi:hypothetical protein
LPLSGLAGNNPASCREKNTSTPELFKSWAIDASIFEMNT